MYSRVFLTRSRLMTLIAVVVMLAVGPVSAAERVERSGPAPADGRVTIENIVGSIEVVGWDRDEVKLVGTLGDDVEDLEFETGARSVIEVVYPKHAKNLEDGADLVINVPRDCDLEVRVVAADVIVSDLRNVVKVTGVSGRIEVSGPCDELEISSVSGSVEVTGGGRNTVLNTVTGAAGVSAGAGSLSVNTVTGDVDVVFEVLDEASINTVGGRIELELELASRADLEVDSISGDIVLTVADDVNAQFEVTTFSGDIDNDFGETSERTDRYVPGEELKFSRGGGDADVMLNTMSGSVKIRRR